MSFSEWREVKLGDISDFAKGRISISEINVENYVSTDNMLPNKGGKVIASSLPITKNVLRYSKEQTLISNIRPYFKKIWFANTNGGCSSDVLVFKLTGKVAPKYFYYCLSQDSFFDYVMAGSKGTKMPRGDKQQIMMYPFLLPPYSEQKAIAATFSCLDDKIELNNRINKNLEEMAQAIFKSWFVDFEPFQDGEFEDSELGMIPKGWRVASLTDIADYLNGLAMQKFRSQENEIGIPVLKIKELRQGFTDTTSDRCTKNIKPEYIINDGDVVFSWSGSLLVDFWCGGICGLNQHLFKVTSKKYDKWFYYLWTKHHLSKFIDIAADKATTMGHIKRGDLANSKVLIPDEISYGELSRLLGPKFDFIITKRVENRQLMAIRDTLLPKLMNGEIRVPFEDVIFIKRNKGDVCRR